MSKTEVAVVGSGPSGLAAAFRLQQAGWTVALFDREARVGGKMRTVRRDDYVIEQGPNIMSSAYNSILGIAREAGLGDAIVPAGHVMGFLRDGQIHNIDTTRLLRDGIALRLVSGKTKLRAIRILGDCLRRRRALGGQTSLSALAADDCESGAEYAERTLGREGLDYLVSPAVRSLIGTPPEQVSKVDVLYTFSNFLQKVSFVNFSDGMSSYAEGVARRFDVRLEADIESVKETAGGVELVWRDAARQEHREEFAGCVLAVNGQTTSRIDTELDHERRDFLSGTTYSKFYVLTAGLAHVPANIPASLVLIPEVESKKLVAISFDHNISPWRVPKGKGLVSIYASLELIRQLPDDDSGCIKAISQAADELIPGLLDRTEFTELVRWDNVALGASLGYWRRLSRFEVLSSEHDRRIQLAGDYFCPSNINSASAAGERAAARLIKEL